MSNKITIQHKRSSTAGVIPPAAAINVGEIAINLADSKLFTKDESNNVIELSTNIDSDAFVSAYNNAVSTGDIVVISAGGATKTDLDSETARITALNSDVSIIQAKLDSDEANIASLNADINTLSSSVTGVWADLAITQARLDSDEANISSLNADLNTLSNSVGGVWADLAITQARLDSDEANIASLNAAINAPIDSDAFVAAYNSATAAGSIDLSGDRLSIFYSTSRTQVASIPKNDSGGGSYTTTIDAWYALSGDRLSFSTSFTSLDLSSWDVVTISGSYSITNEIVWIPAGVTMTQASSSTNATVDRYQ